MATFSYARKDGSLGTIEAPDSKEALKRLPADAAPNSGVQATTGTPASLPTLPTGGGAASSTPLPDSQGSPLLSFAERLNQAVNLGRKRRNASSLDIMKPFAGTAAASDFGSILGNLNRASDSQSSDLIKNATKAAEPDLLSVSEAQALRVPYGTTKAEAAAKGIIPEKATSSDNIMLKSGNLIYTRAKYAEDSADLEASRGDDGWIDPTDYKLLYDEWVANGGLLNDFIAKFPPALYINPGTDAEGRTNDWLPPYLRPKSVDDDNPYN